MGKCTLCPLFRNSLCNNLPGDGPLSARILLVGEAPGGDEERLKETFVGRAGKLVKRCCETVGISWPKVRRTNCVRCRPPDNRTPTDLELQACRRWLHREVRKLKELRVIVALGATAARNLLGQDHPIPERGFSILNRASEFIPASENRFGVPIILAVHPDYCLRNPGWIFFLELQLLKAARLSQSGIKKPREWPKPHRVDSLLKLQKMVTTLREPAFSKVFDLETTGTDLTRDEITLWGYGRRKRAGRKAETWVIPWRRCEELPDGSWKTIWEDWISDARVRREALRKLRTLHKTTFDWMAANGKFDCNFSSLELGFVPDYQFDVLYGIFAVHSPTDMKYLRNMEALSSHFTLGVNHKKKLFSEAFKAHGTRKPDQAYPLMAGTQALESYLGGDLASELEVGEQIRDRLAEDEESWDHFFTEQMSIIKCSGEMERRGAPIDLDRVVSLREAYQKEIERRAVSIRKSAARQKWEGVFNPRSPKQIRELLFEKMGLVEKIEAETGVQALIRPYKRKSYVMDNPPLTAKTREFSTKDDFLSLLKHPLVNSILRIKQLMSADRTTLQGIQTRLGQDGRLRSDFRPDTASTRYRSGGDVEGRGGSNVNVQNWATEDTIAEMWGGEKRAEGKHIRPVIVAPPGRRLAKGDYVQMEVWIARAESDDPFMSKLLESGRDFHRGMTADLLGKQEEKVTHAERWKGKRTNFGIIYGAGIPTISEVNKIPPEEVEPFYYGFLDRCRVYMKWAEHFAFQMERRGYASTAFGAKRHFPWFQDPAFEFPNKSLRFANRREAVNHAIQGGGAGIIHRAERLIQENAGNGRVKTMAFPKPSWRRLAGLYGSILQVHDELVVEYDEHEEPEVLRLMAWAMEQIIPEYEGIRFPVDISTGPIYDQGMEKVDLVPIRKELGYSMPWELQEAA